jgi:hypothetical protein
MEPAAKEECAFIRLVTLLYRSFVACNKDCRAENWSSICRLSCAQRSAHSSRWQAPLRFIINNNTHGSMALSAVRVPEQFTSWIIHRGLHTPAAATRSPTQPFSGHGCRSPRLASTPFLAHVIVESCPSLAALPLTGGESRGYGLLFLLFERGSGYPVL